MLIKCWSTNARRRIYVSRDFYGIAGHADATGFDQHIARYGLRMHRGLGDIQNRPNWDARVVNNFQPICGGLPLERNFELIFQSCIIFRAVLVR